MLRVKATAIATICLSIIGCGGGSSDPESSAPTDSNNSVLTGVFVDSAVEGISYSTATQSDTTNAQGQFNYMAGEQITFSIGATQLPTVTAAAQVSPVDMAAGSANPTATTTNIARLLQSLDSDGNADNGITIPPAAAATVATINFNVSVDEFANDTDVINLVANSGSTTTALISAEAANTHLDETLNGPSANLPISGLWARGEAGAPGFDGYLDIGTTSLVQYNVGERDSSSIATCYEASTITISPLGDGLYDISGQAENVRFIRVGDNLEVTADGSATRAYPLVTDLDPTTLPMCGVNGNESSSNNFNQSVLVDGSPWYSIRAYNDRQECGSRFSFAVDGSLTGATSEGAGTGTYSLSDSGLLTLDTEAFGVENWQLNDLNNQEWSTNLTNNDGDEYLLHVFSGRAAALAFSNSLGKNCATGLPE